MEESLFLPIVGWDEIVNVGDQVILDIVDHVFGYRPLRVSNDVDHLLGIGSLFFLASARSHIWGTGILTSDEPIPPIRPENVRALRGLKTADRLTREGYRLPDVPFGDPGIFVSEYLRPSSALPSSPPKEIIIIPHHSTYPRWIDGRFANSAEVEIVDPCTSENDFLQKIASSNVIISESLHGLVFAAAFGKRAVWIGDPHGDPFKYHDWFTMVDSPPTKSLDANAELAELIGAARIFEHRIHLGDLRRSFPHEVATRRDGGRVGYRAARDQRPFCFFFQDHHRPLTKGNFSATFCYDLAASAADVIFDCWDDRPYALGIVHRFGILPNRRQLDLVLYEMDHHLHHDFAVIATKQQVAAAGLQMHPLADSVSWAKGDLVDVSAVLIRPSGKRRGNNYVIFCV